MATVALAGTGRGAGQTLDGIHKIRHVVVIVQENRSFDSYFGTYPGADGIARDPKGEPVACVPHAKGGGCQRPYHDGTDRNSSGPHGVDNAVADIDGGRMDGFLRQAEDVMGFHDRRCDPQLGLVLLTRDDWRGFYDHVPPPRVDENGYGLRVPGLVPSPYARRGYIDHQVLSFDAYAKFIEDDFLRGARLDPRTDGRADPRPTVREALGTLAELSADFDFAQRSRPAAEARRPPLGPSSAQRTSPTLVAPAGHVAPESLLAGLGGQPTERPHAASATAPRTNGGATRGHARRLLAAVATLATFLALAAVGVTLHRRSRARAGSREVD